MDVKFVNTRKQFIEEFEHKTGDKIISLEMAELCAPKFVLDQMDLMPVSGQKSVWGIFAFCENGLYFYNKPSDNAFTAMIRAASGVPAPTDQLCALHKLSSFGVSFPLLNFWQKLSFRNSCRLDFSFKATNGTLMTFYAFFGKKAESVFNQVQKYCGCSAM